MAGMDIGLSGLVSGFDWRTFIDKMIEIEREPETRLQNEKSTLQSKNSALSSLKNQLNSLKSKIDVLNDKSLFYSRQVSVSNTNIAQATVSAGAPIGSYQISISQFATSSYINGGADIGAKLSSTSDVSGVIIGSAPFFPSVTAGTFTVDGKQIQIATTDTLQDVFDKISQATNGDVTAAYDPETDRIVLSKASGELILGSAADTSNFLQAAKLYNNGTNTISSSDSLGRVKLDSTLTSANFATQIEGSSGEFKINGVSITWNTTDTVRDVLDRINSSNAGVVASYDATSDRFVLTSKSTGDLNLVVEDVTGNFLAATGLSSGTLTRGQDMLFSINGGAQIRSSKNIIDENVSGIKGLTIQPTDTNSAPANFSVTVSNDTSKIKTAINDFITEYNKTQSLIATQTAVTIGSDGKITTAVLTDQPEVEAIAAKLRSMVNGLLADDSSVIKRLEQLGIVSNGNDNTIVLSDSSKLDDALNNNLSAVQNIFTNTDTGLATKLSAYLDSITGDEGLISRQQSTISKQSKSIDDQISAMEKRIEADRQRMIDSFIQMEEAQAKINQQLQFLAQRFGVSSNNS
ncbi:MAG: flagellar filament capping protein FliD [Verrucomicrobiia bacterium]